MPVGTLLINEYGKNTRECRERGLAIADEPASRAILEPEEWRIAVRDQTPPARR